MSLGSTIVTRFAATTDTLTTVCLRTWRLLRQTVLPDYCVRRSDHSVSNHPCADRGSVSLPSEASRLVHRFGLQLSSYSSDFAMTWQARPVHRPNRVHSVLVRQGRCYGLAVPFPLLSTMRYPTAVKVPYPAAVSQTTGERTSTVLDAHHLRRTMATPKGVPAHFG